MKEQLTFEAAKNIIDAFGPCTSTYECTSPDELIMEHAESRYGCINDFVQMLVSSERTYLNVSLDHRAEAISGGDRGSISDEKRECRELVEGALTRLRLIGYTVR